MTHEEKEARKERDRKAVEDLKKEAVKRYGPGGGVSVAEPVNVTPRTAEQRRAAVQAEISRIQSQPGFIQGVAQDTANDLRRRLQSASPQPTGAQTTQPTSPQPTGAQTTQPTSPQPTGGQTPPGYVPGTSSTSGFAPTPTGQLPPQPTGAQTTQPASQQPTGGQVTQRAANMNAQPLTGRVSPAAPAAAPRQPLGSTVTPARPQPAPQPSANTGTVNTGGMNQPMDINDFDDEQQTGGPSERNRALPQPTATPFAQRPLRGSTVTRAARTFNTRGNATSRLA